MQKKPIVQVAKRIQEKNNASVIIPKRRSTFSVISTSEKNNSFLLRNGTYVVLTETLDKNNFICQMYRPSQIECFFTKPCQSTLLNIAFVKKNLRLKRKTINVNQLYKKRVRLPVESGYVFIPLLHTVEL